MFQKLQSVIPKLKPYKSILLFMVVLLTANLLWKIILSGDEDGSKVLLFGTFDISLPFDWAVFNITRLVRMMLTFVGVESFGHYANEITLQNHFTVLVVWGCTAIKQSFIFLCIMLITPGPEKHKFWYIPLGLILIYFINVFRIFAITLICKDYPQYFYFLHYYLFKYIFYVLIFFIWIFWEEKINMKKGT